MGRFAAVHQEPAIDRIQPCLRAAGSDQGATRTAGLRVDPPQIQTLQRQKGLTVEQTIRLLVRIGHNDRRIAFARTDLEGLLNDQDGFRNERPIAAYFNGVAV
ncbi:MAG TPA: hypothetical protein VFV87_14455, partial [Pirellulaceae bacterium]|nr:hypothetical protein [Pirellulaceae bacterium]